MLREMTLDGTFTDKVAVAIERIQTHRDRRNEKTYLAFGGGKDSVVVYDLAKKAGIPHRNSYISKHYNSICGGSFAPCLFSHIGTRMRCRRA